MTTSAALVVTHSGRSSGPPRTIVFQLTPISPLYLGALTLTENTGLSGINGNIPVGSAGAPSSCSLQMSTATFTPVWDYVGSHTHLTVTLTYDSANNNLVSAVTAGTTL
jgi:hypothetical protein